MIERILPTELGVQRVPDSQESRPKPSRSYSVTTDEQRYQFVQKIISKELTVKEVDSSITL